MESNKFIWGLSIIFIGVVFFARNTFGFEYDPWQIIFPALIIALGLSMIFKNKKSSDAIFSDWDITLDQSQKTQNVIFSQAKIDLTKLTIDKKNLLVEINTIFARTDIKVSKTQNYEIEGNAVFGEIVYPDSNRSSFNKIIYKNKNYDSKKPRLIIRLNTVFGQSEIFEK